MVSTFDADTVAQIEARLAIVGQAEKTASVIGFKAGSSLVVDRFSNALFLVKDNVMHYEIDPAEIHWHAFLLGIDGKKTVGQLLAEVGCHFAAIQTYLDVCLKERFLVLVKP